MKLAKPLRRFSQSSSQFKSKWSDPSFDKDIFQKQFDKLRPETNEYFDRSMKVYGLNDGQFLINHYWINGSVVIFPKRFYMWNIVDADEIRPHTLEIMNFVKPRPDYLIIGTGETNVMLDESFYEHFRRMGISVDTCPTFEACSTFNMCIEDDYNVACALLKPTIQGDKAPEHYDEEAMNISGMIGLGNEGFGKEAIKEREMKKLK